MLRVLAALVLALVLPAAALAASPTRGTEILWDRYGVAHVYAKTTEDLFYGYGWAQTKSHANTLLKLYAEARGRSAEYYGPDGLTNDRWMAVNDVPARSATWLRRQSPEFRRYLEAFAKGVNDYAARHPEALSEEARRVLPVTATDVVGHAQRLFQFVYMAPAAVTTRLPVDAPPDKEPSGSNGWAIAPSRSANGAAMLLMNPHLPWAPGWSTYYEIHLTAPGIDLYGASQLGLPVLRFMFSNHVAFTQTVNSINGVTYYRLAPAEGGYRFDGRTRRFSTRTATLKVRQPDGRFTTETVAIRASVHGPVIAERDGAPIAMRVTGLDRPFALEQYWLMGLAKNFRQYETQLKRLQVPTFNIVYADRDGHIQYLYNGLIPHRAQGDFAYWNSVVPGDTSSNLWTGYRPYEELPKATDPAGGTAQNSNDPPWNAGWPATLDPAPYTRDIPALATSLRAARGMEMLAAQPRLTYDQLVAYKWSTHVALADRILPELLEATATYGTDLAKQAAAVLARWDRQTLADSRGALLFLNWSDRKGAASGYADAGFATKTVLNRPFDTPDGLADPRAAALALDEAAKDMLAAHGALDAPWGQAMRLRIDGTDLPANGGPGRLGVFNVVDYGPAANGTRAANFGSTWSAVVSFDQPRARAKVLLSYGNSSQPGTPHDDDQLPLLAAQQLRDVWRTRQEVEANLESRDTF